MTILRKLSIGLCALFLSFTLFALAWASIGQATIHNRQTVKGWFDKSGFYTRIVDIVLNKVEETSVKQGKPLPIDDPALQTSVKQAFSPEFLRSSVNTVLDSSYSWLGGSAKDLDFTVDLTQAKQQIADGVGSYVAKRVETLPPCAAAIRGNNGFDGFSATCRPNGLNAVDASKIASQDFLKQDFLKDAVFNADSLKLKNANGEKVPLTSDTKVTTLRTAYQRSSQLPIVLAVISLILAIAIIFMSTSKLKGIRRVGYTFFSSGVILLITYIAIGLIFTAVQTKINQEGASGSAQTMLMINFIKTVTISIKAVLVWYTVAYLVIGVGAFVLSKVLNKQPHQVDEGRGESTQIPERAPDTYAEPTVVRTPVKPIAKPVVRQQDFPRKKPRLIQ